MSVSGKNSLLLTQLVCFKIKEINLKQDGEWLTWKHARSVAITLLISPHVVLMPNSYKDPKQYPYGLKLNWCLKTVLTVRQQMSMLMKT